MARRVFVSSPTKKHLTERQRRIGEAIVERIRAENLIDQIFDVGGIADRVWSPEDCFEVMRKCCGAVLIGFPRWVASERGKPVKLTTEFVHYEGVLARAMRLPILTIIEEGIAERGVIEHPVKIPEEEDESWANSDDFNTHFNAWLAKLRKRHDVFLGYCSKAQDIADAVDAHLSELGLSVRNWRTDFNYGRSIIGEIEAAARDCSCAIFIFSEDDEQMLGTERFAAPRDNVIFETGLFLNARGRDRVMIIREGNAKMPADLGGIIYAALPNRADPLAMKAVTAALTSFTERAL